MDTTDKNRVNFQRQFKRQPLGCDATLDYPDVCKHYSLESLWYSQLRNDLIFLYRVIYGLSFLTSCPTTIHDSVSKLTNNAYTLFTAKRLKPIHCEVFTARYSLLWNRLLISVRNYHQVQETNDPVHRH